MGALKITHTFVDKSRLMPVLWIVTSSPTKGARHRRDPVLLLSIILIREPGLEGTTCPVACAPAEYHPHKGARPRRDHVSYYLCSC